MAHITVDDSENLEKAIKRFKRLVEKEGIIRDFSFSDSRFTGDDRLSAQTARIEKVFAAQILLKIGLGIIVSHTNCLIRAHLDPHSAGKHLIAQKNGENILLKINRHG